MTGSDTVLPPNASERRAADCVGALARARAALESELLDVSLELRRASEEYEALATAFGVNAARLRAAGEAVARLRADREALQKAGAALRAELEATCLEREAFRREREEARRERDEARRELAGIHGSRLWRIGTFYWDLLEKLGLLAGRPGGAPVAAPKEPAEPAVLVPAHPASPPDPGPEAEPPVEAPRRSFGSRPGPRVAGLPDVVCFSIVEWEFLYQRPQQLLSRLADRGHRVFYVSQFFGAAPGEPVLHRLRPRVFALRLRGSARHLFSEEPPPEEADALFESLAALRAREGLDAAVSVVHQPFWWPLAERARSAFGWKVLYDCMDDHEGFRTNARPLAAVDRAIREGADALVASARVLEGKLRRAGRPVTLLPNGCDADYFAAVAPRARGGRPTVGYFGCIADWFDANLVADVAARRPEWDFVLIGPTYLADLTRLPSMPNVSFGGLVPYGRLVERIGAIDVFLLPFLRSPLTEAANPVKAWEVMATGRPLVSVPLPELEPFGGLVRLASDAAGFERQIEEALLESDGLIEERRRDFARRNSWDARAAVLGELVKALGAGPQPAPGPA